MKAIMIFIVLVQASMPALFSQGDDGNWTHFRGNDLNGMTEQAVFPVSWNDSSNIAWKTEIPGKGWSSPVVFGKQVWCTTASKDGKTMSAVCIDFETGEMLHNLTVFEPEEIFRKHAINSYATPTPCIEEGFVYVHFGRYGTACLRTDDAAIVWKRTDLHCKHIQGPGSSPVLYKDLLILHMEGMDIRYIIALDKRTGETVWKTGRPEELYEDVIEIGRKAYITPLIMEVDGRDLLISNGSAVCCAYEPDTGKEIWRVHWGGGIYRCHACRKRR